MKASSILFPVSMILTTLSLHAQPSRMLNASFEGEARDATVPRGWLVCTEGSTPDILPGVWGVYNEASHGDTYVGLITRENSTWESLGQRLTEKLLEGRCYQMSLDVARSDTYSGYHDPIKLRIWCGKSKCERDELILETDFIRSLEWQKIEVRFTPKADMDYILFEAFIKDGTFSHQGNVLIDNISAIVQCGRS